MRELDYKVNMTLTVTQKYRSTKRNKITYTGDRWPSVYESKMSNILRDNEATYVLTRD